MAAAVALAGCVDSGPAVERTARVDRGPVESVVTAVGTVQPLSLTNVSSQLSGRVVEVLADFNDRVSRGQPLVRLEPETYQARVREARAELELATGQLAMREAGLARALAQLSVREARRAVLDAERSAAAAAESQASAEKQRQRALAGRGTASERDLQDAEAGWEAARAGTQAASARRAAHEGEIAAAGADVAMAEAEVGHAGALIRQREAALAQAELDLERTVVHAPFDGVVIRRSVEPGQTIASSLHAPTLFTLARDLAAMRVEARVDEADIGLIAPGQGATFRVDAHPGRRFDGLVEQIRMAPELVQNVVTYTVLISAPNPQRALLPGMTATVDITVALDPDALRVPNAALRFRPPPHLAEAHGPPAAGTARLWLAGDGAPQPRDVVLGTSDATHTVVRSGDLAPGDHLVVALERPD